MPRQPANPSKIENRRKVLYFAHKEIAKLAEDKNLSVKESETAAFTVQVYKNEKLVFCLQNTSTGRIRIGYWENGFAPRITRAFKPIDAYEMVENLIKQLK